MMFSRFLDKISDYLAARKGLLQIIGLICIIINFAISALFPASFASRTNFALHVGLILAVIGQLLAWVL